MIFKLFKTYERARPSALSFPGYVGLFNDISLKIGWIFLKPSTIGFVSKFLLKNNSVSLIAGRLK